MRKQAFFGISVVSGALLAGPASAAGYASSTAGISASQASAAAHGRRGAEQQIHEAMQLVQKMKSDPEVSRMLERARGVFLVPDYGRLAAGIGGSGGSGVLLVRQGEGDTWSNPLFYSIGAVSFGAQAGASAGEIALVLMNDKAVQSFRQQSKFSLDAKAGLAIANFSAGGQDSWGRGDIVLWKDTEGAYAGATIAISDISFDEDESRAYYGAQVTPNAPGAPAEAPQEAKQLKQELALSR